GEGMAGGSGGCGCVSGVRGGQWGERVVLRPGRAERQGPGRGARGPDAGFDESPGVHSHPLEDHQIVTMDHFIKALVPEPLLDLLRLRAPDLSELRRVEVDDPPRELRAASAPAEGYHFPRREVALDLDYA